MILIQNLLQIEFHALYLIRKMRMTELMNTYIQELKHLYEDLDNGSAYAYALIICVLCVYYVYTCFRPISDTTDAYIEEVLEVLNEHFREKVREEIRKVHEEICITKVQKTITPKKEPIPDHVLIPQEVLDLIKDDITYLPVEMATELVISLLRGNQKSVSKKEEEEEEEEEGEEEGEEGEEGEGEDEGEGEEEEEECIPTKKVKVKKHDKDIRRKSSRRLSSKLHA